MAQSYDRRINLYINIDGKEVKNNVASIKAEMNKIVNEQARMTIGSKEYEAQVQKIKQLKKILAQHAADVAHVDKSWSFAKMGDSFNRYFSLITAGMASLVGLALSVRQVVQSFNDFEERLDNLSALTGLSGDNLTWLGDKAKELSTATLEGGIRVTYGAQQIVDAFTKTGSARPELLKNKEALVAVTTEAIILASAAKTELQPAIEALTMVMNQYNTSATEARRIINVLAAGSLAGAGEIPYLTVGFEKAGTQASLAGLSIETLGAALETLAPRLSEPEIAARGLKGLLLKLQTGADDTNPKIVGFTTAIENLGKKSLSVTEKVALFKEENITVADILITNVGELKNFEKAMTGTNTAIEQAAINTDNNNAKLTQAKNRLNLMSIELGEKLAPALTISTSGLSHFIRILSITIDFFVKYRSIIVTTTVAVMSYVAWVKLEALWEERKNKTKLISIALGKLQDLGYRAQFAGIALYNAGIALLKGNLAAASVQMRLFTGALMANPIGLIIGVVAALSTALIFYAGRATAAQKAQQMLNDVNLTAQKNIVEEKIQLGALVDLARNESLSKMDRLKAIMQLTAISPKYLGGLSLENINTKAANESIKAYTESILQNARAQAAKEKLVEIDKELLDLQSGKGADVSYWQGAGNAMLSFGNTAKWAALNAASATKNLTERQAELNAQKETLVGITKEQAIADLLNSGGGSGDPVNNDLIRAKELELELANKMPRSTEAEIIARNKAIETIQKEIDRLNALGTVKEGVAGEEQAKRDEKAIKAKMDVAEAAHNTEMSRINREHLEGKTSDDQYKADLLSEDLKFLDKKLSIYKKGSKEYEAAYNESLAKQVDAEKVVKDLLAKAQKELADAKIENLQDGIDKEKAIQEQRFKEEIDALKKQLNDKKDLKANEIALNDTIQQTIAQKTTAHHKAMTDLDTAALLQKQMNAALIDEAKAGSDEEHFAAQRELAQAQYQQDIADANGNAAKIAQAERALSDNLIQIKIDELNKKEEIGNAMFNAANNLFGSLSELAGKETALGKALFLFQQAAAIGQIIFSTMIANAKAKAMLVLPPLWGPVVAVNWVSAAANIATVVAQSIAQFSPPKHATGGFTQGETTYIAGEAGTEWIAPNWMTTDPAIAPIIAGLERWRKNPISVSSGAIQASQSNSKYGPTQTLPGGVGLTNASAMGAGIPSEVLNRVAIAIENNERQMARIENWNPELIFSAFEREHANWKKTTTGGLK